MSLQMYQVTHKIRSVWKWVPSALVWRLSIYLLLFIIFGFILLYLNFSGTAHRNETIYNGSLLSKEQCKEVFCHADAVCFDVDSTVIRDEGLDQLAAYCGKAEQVRRITEEAMKGGMEFRDALRLRLNIIKPSLEDVKGFINENPPKLTKDVDVLIKHLHKRNVDVYLVSGGFFSLIAPVAKLLHIPLENVFTNRLKFYFDGTFAGFDEFQPTSRSGGKAEVIRILKQKYGYNSMVMIGDGATDMEASPPAEAFIGFGGNVVRQSVKKEATWFVTDFKSLVNVSLSRC